LKIENQTLNEKIEERNDELSKLRAKIVANVIILSHNREKYQFILKSNDKQNMKLKLLEDDLKKAKEQLAADTSNLKKKQF
jgi:histone deacetylase 6